jgi:hypothetical protein
MGEILFNILTVALGLIPLAMYLVLAAVLLRQYLRTRDAGFVWLGVAVVIWPFVSRLLDLGQRVLIDRLLRRQLVGFYPFSLVEHGQMTVGSLVTTFSLLQHLVGVSLLLVAVLCLCKAKSDRNPQPS